MTNPQALKLKQGFHFLPVLIIYVFFVKYFLLPSDAKLEVLKGNDTYFDILFTVNITTIWVSGVFYALLSLNILLRYKKSIRHQFSNTEKINFNWLLYLIIGMVIIWILILFLQYDPLIFGSSVVFILWIGYFGIKQVNVFSQKNYLRDENGFKILPDSVSSELVSNLVEDKNDLNQEVNELPVVNHNENTFKTQVNASIEALSAIDEHEDEGKPDLPETELNTTKYQKSNLSKAHALQIHQQLKRVIAEEKLYKNPDLTLYDLANYLKVHPNNLSQVINSLEGKNFYDYINKKRIDQFLTLTSFPENRKYTFLSLAFECGFNSKTAFNRNFKKITGYTPSEYIKQNNTHLP